MATNMKQHKLGWIGIGRMGYAMAERLAKSGCDIAVWNRTKAKAEPLAKSGAKVVDALTDLAGCDIVFTMVSTGKDVKEVLFGANGVMSKGGKPKIVVDSTSISLEESAEIRAKLAEAKGEIDGADETTSVDGGDRAFLNSEFNLAFMDMLVFALFWVFFVCTAFGNATSEDDAMRVMPIVRPPPKSTRPCSASGRSNCEIW